MRPTRLTEVKVGAFVVIILVLLAVAIFSIGSHQKYFQSQYTLWVSFSNIKGLIIGSPVRLAGLTVGRVSGIYFHKDLKEKTIKVELKINKGVQERIRADSTATIQTMGLLGDKYVEITIGSPESKPLPDRASIKGIDPVDLFTYVAKTEEVIDAISTILSDIKDVSTQIRSGEGFLHALLYDPAGGELVRNLSVASASLDDLIKEISNTSRSLGSIVGKGGGDLIRNLSVASASLEEVMKEVSSIAKSLNKIVKKVEKGEGSLGAIINDPTVYEDLKTILGEAKLGDLMNELSSVAQSLNKIVKKVEKGEGSLGAIINDPTVYEDLKTILGGAKRSKVIKGLIRYSIKKKKEKEEDGEAGR